MFYAPGTVQRCTNVSQGVEELLLRIGYTYFFPDWIHLHINHFTNSQFPYYSVLLVCIARHLSACRFMLNHPGDWILGNPGWRLTSLTTKFLFEPHDRHFVTDFFSAVYTRTFFIMVLRIIRSMFAFARCGLKFCGGYLAVRACSGMSCHGNAASERVSRSSVRMFSCIFDCFICLVNVCVCSILRAV
jgi:hypothetical protein